MRYGSVPEGYDKSMTHLEYDEAQRLNLPSLIYLLDDGHPIPPKDVETGVGAERLQALKEHLKKRHVISFFTTPEDLQTRIMHDVPIQLDQMGVEVTAGLARMESVSDREVLKKFALLPKLYSGRSVTIRFPMARPNAAVVEDCSALNLEIGATVVCYNVKVSESQEILHIYGQREVAVEMLSLPEDHMITARAITAFGQRVDVEWTDEDGPVSIRRAEKGIVITEILSAEPPNS
jgi:hypothetical protein